MTNQGLMAGTAPADLHFTRTLDAMPVHCGGEFLGRLTAEGDRVV